MMTAPPVTQREAARGLLTAMFANRHRILISEVLQAAAERGISRRTMTLARADLGITTLQNGRNSGIWVWPQ
jgi:hypothetical protein